MKAFIFTAGFGERLRPITDAMPKPLVHVLNAPALCWPLALCKRAGVSDVICNLHHRYGDLVDFFNRNDNFDFTMAFSYEEEILGTGGGLKKCEKLLAGGDFIVLNGDVIMDLDLNGLVEAHRAGGAAATVVLYRHPEARAIAPVGVKDGSVVDFRNFLESGVESDYIYTGAAVLTPEIFQYLETGFSSIVYTAYMEIIRRRRLNYFVHDGYWHDIGSPASLYRVNMEMLARAGETARLMEPLAGVEAVPVSSDAVIARDARVENSVVGEGAVVERGTVVRDSVLLPGSRAEKGSITDKALLFRGSNLMGTSNI